MGSIWKREYGNYVVDKEGKFVVDKNGKRIWKKNGKVGYQIEWEDENGKRCRETFLDRKVAERQLAEKEKEVERRKALGISTIQEVLFEDFVKEYLELTKKKRSSRRDKMLTNNLLTHFRGKYLHQINPHMVEQYRIDREKSVSEATINREVSCLRAIFNKAILWNKFKGENPVRGKGMFYDEPERERYLTKTEMAKFYEALYHKETPVSVRNICLCALNTGMRKEEILSLKWTDIDWQEKKITVQFTKNNRVKTIDINQQLEDILRSIVDYTKDGCPYVFNHIWAGGKRDRYLDTKFSWEKILKRAGITNFRFHDLRHTAGTYMYAKTQNLVAVGKVLGHRDLRSTERYVHAFDSDRQLAIGSLDLIYPRIKIRGEYEGRDTKITKNSQKLATNEKNG